MSSDRNDSTSGWVDGEIDIQEDIPSELNDTRILATWDLSSLFPRHIRFITCGFLCLVGTACLMYRNVLLHRTHENTMLSQIQKSIVEMDEIAATATRMEVHAQRLSALTQTHLEALAHNGGATPLGFKHDKVRADIQRIHDETIKHMQDTMLTMVDTTRQEILDVVALMHEHQATLDKNAIDVPVQDGQETDTTTGTKAVSNHSDTVIPDPAIIDTDMTTSNEEGTVVETPPTPLIPVPTYETQAITPAARSDKSARFWLFTTVGTVIITALIAYWMQRRASFHQDRMAFQDGMDHVSMVLGLCRRGAATVAATCHETAEAARQTVLSVWRVCVGDGGGVHVEDVSDDEVSFFPQTPGGHVRGRVDRPEPDFEGAAEEDDEDSILPRKHITFADVDDSDEENDVYVLDTAASSWRRPSELIQATAYESIVTPDPKYPHHHGGGGRSAHAGQSRPEESPLRRSTRRHGW
ncbi:Aste57867_14922 [Aphanomyces stellatus]|uniref:Aste57867_14922 protein n=1 Tax=Aphanomyces stellatus TaxID=120398 RepID=A0A485L1X8_9STRA|nr:hypothetical protein As57867_014866 [Aphanomyces stellatus]VFT91737.1 Aste57867_14922 [Aphanomyces stellatus]